MTSSSLVSDAAGFEAQLLRVASAQLYLVDGDESLLMKNGDFVVRLTKQSDSPLAVVLASVGDVHWPLGKDSPTLQMRGRHFAFVLSGLIYGLVLPEPTPAHVLAHLEVLLTKYSTFEVRQERIQSAGAVPFDHEEPTVFFWTSSAPEILSSSVKLLGTVSDAGGSASASTILKKRRVSVSAPSEGKVNSSDSGGFDPNARSMKRVQQARRISAVSKLLSRTLVRGALSASSHVAGICTKQMGSSTKARASIDHVAVASVDAIAKIVDAVESAGKSILTSDSGRTFGSSGMKDLNQADDDHEDIAKRKGSRSGIPNSSWTLNRTGLALLFRVTAASAKIYSGGYRSPSTQASSMKDYMSSSGPIDNNSGDLQPGSPPGHRSETCFSSAEGQSPLSSSEADSCCVSELSLFPNPAFNSSLASHTAQQFFTGGASSPQFASVQQQQPRAATPAVSNIGFTPFLSPNRYATNQTFDRNFGGRAPDRQHFYHPN